MGRLPPIRVKSACRHADVFSRSVLGLPLGYYFSIDAGVVQFGGRVPFFAGLAHVLNRVADSPRLGVDAVALRMRLDASAAFWILDLRFEFLDSAFPCDAVCWKHCQMSPPPLGAPRGEPLGGARCTLVRSASSHPPQPVPFREHLLSRPNAGEA